MLLSFSLVALCALPLIRPHVQMARRKAQIFRDLQLERAADDAYTLIKVRLFEHQIQWNQLDKNRSRAGKSGGPLPSVPIRLPSGEQVIYHRSFNVEQKEQWHKRYATYRLLSAHVKVWQSADEVHEYVYNIFVERDDEKP